MWIWPFDTDFPTDDLFEIPLDAPGSEACLRLARLFGKLGDRMKIHAEREAVSRDPEFECRLHDAGRALRELAESRGVRIPWPPIEPSAETDGQTALRLIGDLVETLHYVARQPEFSRRTRSYHCNRSAPGLRGGA